MYLLCNQRWSWTLWELMSLLIQPPNCWNYRCVSLWPPSKFHFNFNFCMFVFTDSVVSEDLFIRWCEWSILQILKILFFFQWKLYFNSKIDDRSQKHRIVQFGFVVLLNLGNIERGFYDHGYAFLNKCVAFLNVVCCMHYWA